jgi:hypothetical protein
VIKSHMHIDHYCLRVQLEQLNLKMSQLLQRWPFTKYSHGQMSPGCAVWINSCPASGPIFSPNPWIILTSSAAPVYCRTPNVAVYSVCSIISTKNEQNRRKSDNLFTVVDGTAVRMYIWWIDYLETCIWKRWCTRLTVYHRPISILICTSPNAK